MNRNTNKNLNSKLPEIIAIFLVVAAVGYYFYSSSSSSSSSSSFTVSTATTTVGGNVLVLLNQIRSLKIDTNFFTSPAYQSLTDFTVSIPTENVGKSDPFLPPGSVGNVAAVQAATTPTTPATSTTASPGTH